MSLAARGGIATKTTAKQAWQRWKAYSRRFRGNHAGRTVFMRQAMMRFRFEYRPYD